MKALPLFLLSILLGISIGYGQKKPRVSKGLDMGSGFKSNTWSPSMLYHQELSFRGFPWLAFTAGVRSWGYYSGRDNLVSQSGNISMDTLRFRKTSQNGLSIVTGLNLTIGRLDMGVNTDLIGLVTGSERHGFYSKNKPVEGQGQLYYNKWVPASPNVFNVLPSVLKDNNGQSELYARIWLTRRVGLKIAYTYGRVAYNTGRVDGERVVLDNGHKHFSNTYGIPYAALSFTLEE